MRALFDIAGWWLDQAQAALWELEDLICGKPTWDDALLDVIVNGYRPESEQACQRAWDAE